MYSATSASCPCLKKENSKLKKTVFKRREIRWNKLKEKKVFKTFSKLKNKKRMKQTNVKNWNENK